MQLFDKLRLSGNDVDGALVRFSSDAEFYKKYLIRFCSENIAAQVAKAAAELDAQATYEQAHLLKGGVGKFGTQQGLRALLPNSRSAQREQTATSLCGYSRANQAKPACLRSYFGE